MQDEQVIAAVWELLAAENETPDQARDKLGQQRELLREVSGERRLCLAMIEDALLNATASTRSKRSKLFAAESRAWITDDAPRPFGFEFCCETLALDPDRIRERLARWDAEMTRPRLMHARLGDDKRRRYGRKSRIEARARIVAVGARAV